MLKIILGTPIWVWGVLIYVLGVGIYASKDRVVYIPKLLITPCVLTALKFKYIIATSTNITFYIIFLIAGIGTGWLLTKRYKITPAPGKFTANIPGSYFTLVILICFFVSKYIFGYLNATAPQIATQYLHFAAAAGGLFPGLFLGRAICSVLKISKSGGVEG